MARTRFARLDPGRRGRPISERRVDWLFVAAFGFFATTSIITDSVNGLNGSLDPDSSYWIERFIYESYAKVADPLLILNPPQVRVSAWISAFIWLPLYLLFIPAFIKGWNWIRPFGLVYGGALTHGMITYMAEGIFGRMATDGWADPALCSGCLEPNTLYYLAANSAYLVIPALMIVRMWRTAPFGEIEPRAVEPDDQPVSIDLRGEDPVLSIGSVDDAAVLEEAPPLTRESGQGG